MGQLLTSICLEPDNNNNTSTFDYRDLIRTTRYTVLNAENHEGSEEAGEVWAANIDNDDISKHWISYSSKQSYIDYFISHAWDDEGYAKGLVMVPTWENGDNLKEFGWRKAVAFQNVVRTIVEMKGVEDRNSLKFWLDKTSIPQYDEELKVKCISSFEGFIKSSHGLIVLLTPRYPKRLWCVYEVACFLCTKPMERVFINYRSFGTSENVHLYIDTIKSFSVERCECKVEFDRSILEAKVNQYYVSTKHFAIFVQAAFCALIIRDYYSYPPMIKTSSLYDEFVGPWLEAMEHLDHLKDLRLAFMEFNVPIIYQEMNYDDDRYMSKLREHLDAHVYPVIDKIRRESCTEEGLSLYQGEA